ncbi:MAG: hypothetical protein IJK89_04100 [Clostridia bacterium]|nr:hypothetical protein [Clostridia bacterium]
MKKTAVKAALIAAAAVTCLCRFISFRYESRLSPEALRGLLIASVAGAVCCAVCAAVWAFSEKKDKNGT